MENKSKKISATKHIHTSTNKLSKNIMSDPNMIINPVALMESQEGFNSLGTQNQYTSPLETTLSNLRRKYVAAAGPHLGDDAFLMEYSSSFYSLDIDGDDVPKSLVEEDNDPMLEVIDTSKRGGLSYEQNISSSGYSRRLSTANLSTMGHRSSFVALPTGSSTLNKSTHRQQSTATLLLPADDRKQVKQPSSFLMNNELENLDINNRHTSSLASSSHAENLLASAPHLRHISSASAQMQGFHLNKSRNPISYIFGSRESTGGDTETNAYKASMAEYNTCISRDRTNVTVAKQLAAFVRVLSHEMSFEEYAAVEEEIFSHLLKLMHSIDLNERLAGVAGIDALIGVTSADEEMKSTKFAKNLSYAMKANNVEYLYLSGITKALGKIFLGSSNVDYVECEVIKAIEWLRKERSDRR